MNWKPVPTFALMLCLFLWVIEVDGHNPAYEIVSVYGSTPTIDGVLDAHEWGDAALVSFNNTKVFVKQDGIDLYIGFNNSETQFHDDDAVNVLIDVGHDGGLTLQPDEIGLGVYRNGTLLEANVTGGTWAITEVSGWIAVASSASEMWQVEFRITYSKIDVVAGVEKTIGVEFVCFRGVEGSSPNVFSWPPRYIEIYTNPSMWGAISSIGYNWIPEFSPFTIMPLFMIPILLAIMLCQKRKREKLSVR